MKYTILAEGPKSARIAAVCEKPAADEVYFNRLLIGKSGKRVRRHLLKAGLDAGDEHHLSKEVWLTNAVQSFDDPKANPTNDDIIRELPRLYKELCNLPNLTTIIGFGAPALQALSNMQYNDITHRRGGRYITPWGVKFVPTFHPAFYMRGEWRYAPVVQFDIARAIGESTWPEIRKKSRKTHIAPQSLTQALSWLQHLKNSALASKYLSFDIETVQGAHGTWYISCIAFCTVETEAYCIPLMQRGRIAYWPNISDESSIWLAIADLLNLDNVCYITQNGCAFDGWQLHKHGIRTEKMLNGFDTFSAHSLLAPDLPHKLEFISSIYTDINFYKEESGRGEAGYGGLDERLWRLNCLDVMATLESAWGIQRDLREL